MNTKFHEKMDKSIKAMDIVCQHAKSEVIVKKYFIKKNFQEEKRDLMNKVILAMQFSEMDSDEYEIIYTD